MTMHKRKSGFTLIEIMIVVAIVAVLATILAPIAVRARIDANENAAKSVLKTLHTACLNYRMAQIPTDTPPDLPTLANAVPSYIDQLLGNGLRQGYQFNYVRIDSNRFQITAIPQVVGDTGINTFFVDESGVIRRDNAGGPAIG